jgi:hypothetical protein
MAREARRRSRDTEPESHEDWNDPESTGEDTAPRRSTRRSRSDEDGDERGSRRSSRRSSRDDDDEREERGSRRSRRSSDDDDRGGSAKRLGRGSSAAKKAKSKASKFNDDDKFAVEEKEEYVIHFLEEDVITAWAEHWIDEFWGQKRKCSFVCLESLEDAEDGDCPLCEYGLKASYRAAYNIVVFDKKGNPSVKYWIATPNPAEKIEDAAGNKRTSPLNRDDLYFVVSKGKGKGKSFDFKLEKIDASDLDEDFKLEPLDPGELEDLAREMFNPEDVVKLDTRRDLLEVRDEIEDD